MKLTPFQIQGLGLSKVLAAEAEIITVKRHPALQYASWTAVNHPAQRDALLNNPQIRVVLSWVTALLVVSFCHNPNISLQFPGTDPGFPVGGGADPQGKPTYDFVNISKKKKLHGIENLLAYNL